MKYINFILLVLVIHTNVTCNKQELILSNPTSQKINMSGILTNKVETQVINLNYSSHVLSNQKLGIEDATIVLKNQATTYSFNYVSDGRYESSVSFKIDESVVYDLKVFSDSMLIESSFSLPGSITLDSIICEYNENIIINITSSQPQSIIYETYLGEIDTIAQDTTWSKQNLEVELVEINSGSSSFELNTAPESFSINDDVVLKVSIYTLTDDVAAYYQKLYDYRKDLATTNQFKNPPYFYSPNYYGIVHASFVVSGVCELE